MNVTARSDRKPSLAILVAVTATGPLALNLLVPSMPGLQRVFATDYGTVQLALTLYLVGVAAGQLVYGPVSDRFGRRPALLFGLALFVAGSLWCLLAPSIELLIAGRLVQAAGACAGLVLSRAIIRDIYSRDRAASMIGYVMMAMVVAPMVAPSIGAWLDRWFGWWAGFAFAMAAGSAVLAAAWAGLHETLAERRAAAGPLDLALAFWRLVRIPAFCGYAFQGAFSSMAFFSFLGGAPYVTIEILGRSPQEYAIFFLSLSFAYMLGNGLAGRLSPRLGIDRMIWMGVGFGVTGGSAAMTVTLLDLLDPWTLFGSMALISVGNGMALPNGMAGAISVDPAAAGTASGLSGFLQLSLGAGASYTVGALLRDSALPLTAMMLAGSVLGLAAHAAGRIAANRLGPARISPAG